MLHDCLNKHYSGRGPCKIWIKWLVKNNSYTWKNTEWNDIISSDSGVLWDLHRNYISLLKWEINANSSRVCHVSKHMVGTFNLYAINTEPEALWLQHSWFHKQPLACMDCIAAPKSLKLCFEKIKRDGLGCLDGRVLERERRWEGWEGRGKWWCHSDFCQLAEEALSKSAVVLS